MLLMGSLKNVIKKDERLGYLVPIIFSIVGGLVTFLLLRNKNKKLAERLLYLGVFVVLIQTIEIWFPIARRLFIGLRSVTVAQG